MTPRVPADTHALVAGRWDPRIAVVDLAAALDPAARDTDRAVVARPRVTRDVAWEDGRPVPACGLPVSLAVDRERRRVLVVNHAGSAAPDAVRAMLHGHAGAVAELDLDALLRPAPEAALLRLIPTGTGGPVGCALAGDGRHLLVTSGEGLGTEDGGHLVTVLDLATGRVAAQAPLATGAGAPARHPAPHPDFGRFPNPNGIAVTPRHGGLVFTANGGTGDVSVLRLADVLAGRPGAELARVPVATGPFGLAVSPDGALVATADREDVRTGAGGSTVSLIDVGRALGPAPRVVPVRVGTDSADRPGRPMTLAFTPDGRFVFVACLLSGTLSRIDVAEALAGGRGEDRRVALATADGSPPCPRGVQVTAEGGRVLVSGGRRGAPGGSTLWILDPVSLAELGRVGGVGDEAYLVGSVGLP